MKFFLLYKYLYFNKSIFKLNLLRNKRKSSNFTSLMIFYIGLIVVFESIIPLETTGNPNIRKHNGNVKKFNNKYSENPSSEFISFGNTRSISQSTESCHLNIECNSKGKI